MGDRGRAVLEGIRFAAGVATDPSGVVTLWKSATGGKAIGCLPEAPVPELLHASNLLPIAFESPGDLSLLSGRVDGWFVLGEPSPFCMPPGGPPRFFFPRLPPGNVEEALDRVEALAEWAGAVSGSPASEGRLWKSIRAHATLRALLAALAERCHREPAFLTPVERRNVVRAGIFLPPEAHSRLLSSILEIDPEPAAGPSEGEEGDPLIVLARRLI
ncbi:MAG: hypothetical protein WAV26_04125 [Candidatus Deferrimicrobium sp.]